MIEKESLVIKYNFRKLLLFTVFFVAITALFFQKDNLSTFQIPNSNEYVRWIFIFTFGLATFYLIIKLLDRRAKVIIDKNGFWYYKDGLIKWNQIESYAYESRRSKGGSETIFRLQRRGSYQTCIELPLGFLDKNVDDISSAIKRCSSTYIIKNVVGFNSSFIFIAIRL